MGLRELLSRGPRHQELLDGVDIRIVVSGVRGKSATAKRLHDLLYQRGYETLAKITGDFPLTIENGVERPIDRHGPRITLYENRTILRDVVPRLTESLSGDESESESENERSAAHPDSLIIDHPITPRAATAFENQAITEYTMRTFNTTFVKPQVILFTNIRQDHTDTLGKTRQRIARSFARSVPEGTHVISGEQHPVIHEYLETEVHRRDATITQVDIPEEHQHLIGAETIHALNPVLKYFDEDPLTDQHLEELLARQQPTWTHLDDGTRIFNAAKVNDIESTELFRRRLAGTGEQAEVVCPFVFLRRDRRGRTASFVEYINILHDRGLVDRVHIGGAFTSVFARNVTPRAIEHDTTRHSAAEVLDRLTEEALPVVLMANTVDPWMRDLQEEIDHRRAPAYSLEEAQSDPPMDLLWSSAQHTDGSRHLQEEDQFIWGPAALAKWKQNQRQDND